MQFRYRIEPDQDPLNPRTEYDEASTMVCWHSRYELGDDKPHVDDPETWLKETAIEWDPTLEKRLERIDAAHPWWETRDALGRARSIRTSRAAEQAAINKVWEKHAVRLPLYLLDHSGLRISTGSFYDKWDSGQVGWVYMTREKILEEFGGKLLTKAKREQARARMENEVEVYDQYLSGDVWGFIVERMQGDEAEEVDSCWGFFGYDDCEAEAKASMEVCQREYLKEVERAVA